MLKVLEEPEVWLHEIAWQVYLPQPYLLSAKHEGRKDAEQKEEFTVSLTPGKHRIVFRHEVPQRRTLGVPAFMGVYLSIDGETHELSHRQVGEDEDVSVLVPRRNQLGSVNALSAAESALLLVASEDLRFPWKLWIQPISGDPR